MEDLEVKTKTAGKEGFVRTDGTTLGSQMVKKRKSVKSSPERDRRKESSVRDFRRRYRQAYNGLGHSKLLKVEEAGGRCQSRSREMKKSTVKTDAAVSDFQMVKEAEKHEVESGQRSKRVEDGRAGQRRY